MKNRSRPFHCSIAGKLVGITLRHGGGLQEPANVYVRCDERDCQYVDINQPPCPLRTDMFADGSDRRVADYLAAHPGARICYACLTETLGITHDQVRRASWRVKDEMGVSIRPARCALCRHRRVTICLLGEGAPAEKLVTTHASPLSPEPPDGASVEALRGYLRAHPSFHFCAHCLARELNTRPGAVREAMWTLESEPEFHVGTAQCVSCLLKKPVIQFEQGPAVIHGPRRILELLVQSPGTAFCPSCAAFSTDLALAEVRRILDMIEPLPQIERGEGACEACGRWQTVIRARTGAPEDAERVGEVSDVVDGHLRHRGFRIDLLSYRVGHGWRPFALVRTAFGALIPDTPPLVLETVATKIEADELAAVRAREWIDKRNP